MPLRRIQPGIGDQIRRPTKPRQPQNATFWVIGLSGGGVNCGNDVSTGRRGRGE